MTLIGHHQLQMIRINFQPRPGVRALGDMTFGMGFLDSSGQNYNTGSRFDLRSSGLSSRPSVSDQLVGLHGRAGVEIIPEGLFQYRLTSFRSLVQCSCEAA